LIHLEKLINKRRKKHELNSEKYICSQCKRIYYSYAALYVHIRRKHNLTLQEIKENFCNLIIKLIIKHHNICIEIKIKVNFFYF